MVLTLKTKSLTLVNADAIWEDIQRNSSDLRMVKAEFFKSNRVSRQNIST